jgi:hypothetical protein
MRVPGHSIGRPAENLNSAMAESWGTVFRVGWFSRSIRPPDELPNGNDPATVAPGTVGPPTLTAGDPHG